MTIKFNISQQDHVNFNIDHFFNSKKTKLTVFLLRFMPSVLLFTIIFIIEDYMLSETNIIVNCVFLIVWLILFPKIARIFIKLTVLSYTKDSKINDFMGEQVLKLTDNCIEVSNSSTLSQIQYFCVESVFFGHGMFYIYISAINAILVPVSAFSDKEQINTFFNILSQKTEHDFIFIGSIPKSQSIAK